MNGPTQYAAFVKPCWSPTSWVFGPVWTVLYAIIGVSYSTVFCKAFAGKLASMVALPFALNFFSILCTPIHFELKNNLFHVSFPGHLYSLFEINDNLLK